MNPPSQPSPTGGEVGVVIRQARASDLDALALIEKQHTTCPGWTREQFAEELEKGTVLVAELGGSVAAYACYRAVPEIGEVQILDVAVDPARLRRGLGSELLESVLSRARIDGLEKATLEVEDGNTPAVELYEAFGFRVVGRRAKFYNGNRDALLMDLAL